MKTYTVIAITIGILAGGAQAAKILNEDMVLTVDLETGAATLKNVGTVAHKVYIYQIRSLGGFMNPGTRAMDDGFGNITPSTPGAWMAISDSLIVNTAATMAALGANVASFLALSEVATSVAEGTFFPAGYATFEANAATEWGIGNPILPGQANLNDLVFNWQEIGMKAGDTYIGKVVIIPEPATVLALLAVVPVLSRRRPGR